MITTKPEVIFNLMNELSTELDLHYEDGDFAALSPAFESLQAAATLLASNGVPLPDAYVHLNRRYARRQN